MAIDEGLEPKNILRRTRVEIAPYMRGIIGHRRAMIPRMEIAKRWVGYYEAVSRVRPLTSAETAKLEGHRRAYDLASSKLEVFRAAGRYARSKRTENLVALRLAQSRYYEAKAKTLPPEKEEEFREKLVPPKEVYDELAAIRGDIEGKCKRYTAVKYRTTLATALMTPVDRYIAMRSLGASLRDDYAKAYDLSQKGMSMSELVEHYREMKREGEKSK